MALEIMEVIPLESSRLEMLKQIADALAAQFGVQQFGDLRNELKKVLGMNFVFFFFKQKTAYEIHR